MKMNRYRERQRLLLELYSTQERLKRVEWENVRLKKQIAESNKSVEYWANKTYEWISYSREYYHKSFGERLVNQLHLVQKSYWKSQDEVHKWMTRSKRQAKTIRMLLAPLKKEKTMPKDEVPDFLVVSMAHEIVQALPLSDKLYVCGRCGFKASLERMHHPFYSCWPHYELKNSGWRDDRNSGRRAYMSSFGMMEHGVSTGVKR